jgi:hypothetical protein
MVFRTQDMVVVAHLPQNLAVQLAKLETAPLFEQPNKFAEIASFVRTLNQHVSVVWHQAKGMQPESMARGTLPQQSDDS